MPAPECISMLPLALSIFSSLGDLPALWGYAGLGPGQELIPQFLALLAFAGAALLAVLQWPFVALMRRLSRSRKSDKKDGDSC